MISQRTRAVAVCGLTLAALGVAPAGAASATPQRCSSGAHTLSHFGDHVYPETGNGGYTSLHTDVHITYDAATNRFLPGNHVVLTDRAAQCLADFSLDFERTSVDATDGPDMTVQSIIVDGRPAPRGVTGDPRRRTRQQPTAAGLHPGGDRQRRERAER